ncbi:hypothetical protein ABFT80_25045 [Mesorhizobium sp. SB112]|uniref:hypothetical protein n=1 Tax=Mesorhizobium sp. SB112 TaxID=3151853 RepID=UPI003264A82D
MQFLNSSRVVAALVSLSALPAMAMLPEWMAWENQPIENLQVLVLFSGMIIAGAFQIRGDEQWKWFWRVVTPVWLILCARELSWGAAFYPPTKMTEVGPFFASRALWYRPVVYPMVGLIIAAMCYMILRYRTWQKMPEIMRGGAMPWLECGLVVAALLVSISAEGHGGPLSALIPNSLVLEETAELAAYCWLLVAQFRVREFQLSNNALISSKA